MGYNLNGIAQFFVKHLRVVEHENPFSRTILKHRLQTGDRIIFIYPLTGFDEMSSRCQQKAIELVKILTKKKTSKTLRNDKSPYVKRASVPVISVGLSSTELG
jgi:hypothetical protein